MVVIIIQRQRHKNGTEVLFGIKVIWVSEYQGGILRVDFVVVAVDDVITDDG